MKEAQLEAEVKLLRKENEALRRHIAVLQAEVYGARLAAKYLDKELAGRVQQIQLLGRDMKGPAHDKLWNQLEAEIHLHRHKTVIRACRGRNDLKRPMQAPPGHDQDSLKKSQGVGPLEKFSSLRKITKASAFQLQVGKNMVFQSSSLRSIRVNLLIDVEGCMLGMLFWQSMELT